jgi:hypothetical protein
MAKGYLSNRQKNLKLGISSYTENNTVLEVIGKVGIGTTNASSKLHVIGDVQITGVTTLNKLDVNQLSPDGSDFGTFQYVPVANNSGGWSWQPLTSAGGGTLSGINILDNGVIVGTAGSISSLDFGTNIVATATPGGSISTINLSENLELISLNNSGISSFGFFQDEQTLTRNATLADNVKYYTLHSKIIVGSGTTLTLGAGTTIVVDRLNNLDNIKALSLVSSGIVTALNFSSSSDLVLKENISLIENPIEKIMKIDGVNFYWKNNKEQSMGVIAQQIEKVLPELVSDSHFGKTVNYNGLIGLLIEVVKEQQNQIDDLKKSTQKSTRKKNTNK